MQNLTAEQWLEYERNRLQKGYDENGKAPRISDLKESIFVSKNEFEKANTMRIKMCDKEHHTGTRILECTNEHWFFEKGKPVSCKLCKTNGQKSKRKEIREENIIIFTSAAEWFSSVSHDTTNDGLSIGFCRKPKREEFTCDEEFSKAQSLHEEREIEFKKQYHKRKDVRNKDNEYHRQQWANMSKDAKRSRTEQIEQNKMDRRDTALASSDKDWCKYGGHTVDKQDMIFCPIQDLGLKDTYCQPGQMRRCACKNHFQQQLFRQNAFYKKYRADLSLRVRFRLEWWRHAAKQRKKTISLSMQEQKTMVTSACHYCSVSATNEVPNGIDMLDAMCMDYRLDTCVPCCTSCNLFKGGMKKEDFISQSKAIADFTTNGTRSKMYTPYRIIHGGLNVSIPRKAIMYYGAHTYKRYKYGAAYRKLSFEITESDFNAMKRMGCTFCGLQKSLYIGIDRIDSSRGYVKDNVQPACTTCNFMKKDVTNEFFVDQACKIAGKA